MKNPIKSLLLLIGLSLTMASYADEKQPKSHKQKDESFATFNQKYYKDNKIIAKYLGDVVAMTGKIIKKEPGPQGRPILELKLEGLDKNLWVGSIIATLENQLKVGDTVDVLGFLDETKKEPNYMAKLTDDVEYLLAFCYNVHGSGLPIFFTDWMGRCVAWENGAGFNEETVYESDKDQATKK